MGHICVDYIAIYKKLHAIVIKSRRVFFTENIVNTMDTGNTGNTVDTGNTMNTVNT